MLFNSYIFICVFLPVTLIGFFSFTKYRKTYVAKVWLALASLVFYAYWNPVYLPLLLISIVFNYTIGKSISNAETRSLAAKLLLWVGISINLALIGYYKYTGFLVSSVNELLNRDFLVPQMVLPLAISFYTFTQIAYLVDAYLGQTKEANYDLLTYSLFVSFFPQLIAGPILRHDQLIPQFSQRRKFIFSHKNIAYGLTLFSLGLSKKVLIGDSLSPWVAIVFDNASDVTFIEAWIGVLAYTFQLYFDFSGYSDMAIGLGMMFNISLPINFNSPYKSTSITDFWRRWHMTLSNFLRDYLYIPLGGSRKGESRRYSNLLITMLLGGLWHGAGWTFVFWGGMHGAYLAINHWWRKHGFSLHWFLGWMITFNAVLFSWVFFRAHSLSDGIDLVQTMLGMNGIILPGNPEGKLSVLTQFGIQLKPGPEFAYLVPTVEDRSLIVVALFGLTLAVTCLPNTQEIMQKFKPNWWWALIVGTLAAYCLLSLYKVSEFIYYQF
ncbi:MAG: MBOAT family protein [Roseofilum sp. SBFL]|uniref:MBOAT family O-acyltransferase n=1 Tax=unclassified Roseofilum TaxID=2620099 RepID=UPI001B041658|nr:MULTISPECIES: MBOAT family protein [unclassified Roseofilum]MBP0014261.1 MBOAT family protein [Roseofilum sp. SID3]MBP0023750.1 MBOAT family protein [Roseofilum sp. SID2]MBP0038893.1 MBOAT family protein [Roseofilum sp. SID1]MBP0043757.1 MBOAT family protein [Roseofilum sp. SBFL]